jgi:lipopolysaccharide transport system ATP-binding protein
MAAIQGLCHKAMVLDTGKIVYAGETLPTIEYYTLNGNVRSDAKISLKHHPNRVAGCNSVLREIEILSNGEASTNIGMGETLELLVTVNSDQPIQALGVAVEDTLGRRLFVVSPRFTNPTLLGGSTKSAKLICTIPSLPLLPGLYHLTIGVTGFSGTLDKIERAASISVSERDVFKSGGNSSRMKGVFFTHADWRMENCD